MPHSAANIHESRSLNTKASHLVFCTLGIIVSYSIFGYIQEKVFKTKYGPEKETFGFFMPLVFFQCLMNAITAFVCGKLNGNALAKDTVPRFNYGVIAVSYLVAMLTSNASLKHIPYPTQVLGKSCKPIPIMIFGVLLAAKKYSFKKYLCVLFIVIGVALFTYKQNKSSGSAGFSFGFGEILLLVSLAADGTTGALQDIMRRDHYSDKWGMMFFMNFFSSAYLLAFLMYSGEIGTFLAFVLKHNEALWLIIALSCASSLGQCFIFKTVSEFGPLTCSIVTNTRKIFSIGLSAIAFGHAFSTNQIIGTAIVFGALTYDAIESKRSSTKAKVK
uniref:TPT domain-containing protein n=1 Tax=Rhabditophanes sp. KR3021 TaxID=114890 RepID=A0AC35UBX0_9BILA